MKGLRVATLLLAALTGTGLAPASGAAASLRNDILFVLPRESGQVAFLDLAALRASPHYSLLKQRLLPSRFAAFENFLRPLGVDADKDLEWAAWVLVPPGPERSGELFLGLAEGRFSPTQVEEYYGQQKWRLEAYRGQTLFPWAGEGDEGDWFFAFLDSSTAALGTRASLELLLETRFGGHDNLLGNESLLARLNEVNGRGPVWMVFDEHYTRQALGQLVPEAAKFQEFNLVAQRFRSSLLRLSLDREATLSFQAWCDEPATAQAFSLLLQTGLLAQSWQVKKTNPALSAVLGMTEVLTAGDRLEVRVAVAEKDLRTLLEPPRSR